MNIPDLPIRYRNENTQREIEGDSEEELDKFIDMQMDKEYHDRIERESE